MTFVSIAQRSGVHKTTVYRRWATKEALVADALRERSRVAVPIPDTGSLLGDLTALARAVAALHARIEVRLDRDLGSAVGDGDQRDPAACAFVEAGA